MSVDSKHPDHDSHNFMWKKCRDAVEGEEAVKAAGAVYLPQLEGQKDYDYSAYKDRALFYAATARTVKALSGAVLRKPPDVVFPDEQALDDIGASGESFNLLCKLSCDEVITMGRVGLYVDADPDSAGASAPVPYVALYYAENIVNWGTQTVKGRQVLQFVTLLEDHPVRDADEGDGLEYKRKERWRILQLENADTDPKYVVRVYERKNVQTEGEDVNSEGDNPEPDEFVEVSEVYPTFAGGKPIPYIPFQFINPLTVTTETEKPPILDLVNVNLSHYRNSADYEHGLHFTALPTAWVAGFDPTSTKLLIGSQIAWVSENPAAHAGFLEFSGAGLKSIEEAMKRKELQMAVLGSRMLEEQKADAEAAAALRLRHSGEQSVLQHLVKSLDEGLTNVLKWVAEWTGKASDSINVKLNEDFNPLGIDPFMMNSLMMAVQGGTLSWETFFWNVQRGNVIPDGITPEEERAQIEAGPPLTPAGKAMESQAESGAKMADAQANAPPGPDLGGNPAAGGGGFGGGGGSPKLGKGMRGPMGENSVVGADING